MKTFKEYIVEKLMYTDIFEMAVELKDYKDDIKNYSSTLIAHILLVMNARQENSIEYVKHWKDEIRAYLKRFYDIKLKVKNNYKKRLSYIKDILLNKYELDTKNNLANYCANKLFKEGYDIDDSTIYNRFESLTSQFQEKYLDKMIDCMADHDMNKINQFIESL